MKGERQEGTEQLEGGLHEHAMVRGESLEGTVVPSAERGEREERWCHRGSVQLESKVGQGEREERGCHRGSVHSEPKVGQGEREERGCHMCKNPLLRPPFLSKFGIYASKPLC